MMSGIWDSVVYHFAGVWPIIGTFTVGGSLIVGLLAAAYFSPVFKKEFVFAAAVVAVFSFAVSIGVSLGEKRIKAQWNAAKGNSLKVGKKARADAVRDVARKPPRGLQNERDPDLRD